MNKEEVGRNLSGKGNDIFDKALLGRTLLGIGLVCIICIQLTILIIATTRYNRLENTTVNVFRSLVKAINPEAVAKFDEDVFDGKTDKNKKADEALALAEKAIEKGDVVRARMFLLNALNHDPSNSERMVSYYRFCKKHDASDVKSLEQLRNIIETAVYQVAPQEVEGVLKLYADVTHDIDGITAKVTANSAKESEEKIRQSLESLTSGELSWDNIVKDEKPLQLKLLQRRVETCEELASADDNEAHESELELTMRSAFVLRIMDVIEQTLNKAESSLDGDGSKLNEAGTQLQSARNHLATIWGLDLLGLPSLITERVETITGKIKNLEASYNTKQSKLPCEQLDEIVNRIKYIDYKNKTDRINAISKDMMLAQKTLLKIFDSALRDQYEKKLVECNKILEKLLKDRVVAYNKWAVDQCKAAFDKWNGVTVFTDDDAIKIGNEFLLEIDTRHLLPATAEFYNDLLNGKILIGELSGEKRANLHIKLALTPKKRLEDF